MNHPAHPVQLPPSLSPRGDGWPWTGPVGTRPADLADRADWPRITIVTPSFNQGRFIEETLRSVHMQGYPNLEHIVMDGGSTDYSVDVIRNYAPCLVHWQSGKDGGQSDAINTGMAMATGDVCAWLNSDDVLTADALWRVGDYFADHPACRWLAGAGRLDFVDEGRSGVMQSRVIGRHGFLDFWRFGDGSYVMQPSAFWRRDLWRDVGGLDPALHYAMDYDLWLRFAERTALHTIDTVLSAAKRHGDCKTIAGRDKQILEMMRAAYLAAGRAGIAPARLTARMMAWIVTDRLRTAKRALETGDWRVAARGLFRAATQPPRLVSEAARVRAIMEG